MSKVLLVEDDNNLREIYEARLQAEGYTIVSAQDGEEALVVAKNELPDLIISDVMMPKISGFEMLDILRNTDGLKEVKVIMLTALGQSDDQQRADRLGADRYLVKSQVTLEDIVKVSHELLEDNGGAAAEPAAAAPEPTPAPAAVPEPAAPTTAPVAVAVAPDPTPVVGAPAPAPVPEPVAVTPVPEPVAVAPAPAPVPEPVAVTPAPASEDPVASAPTDAVANAKSALTAQVPQSASQEEAAVEAKIEDFVSGASSNANPAAPTTTTTESAAAVADDKVMDAALTNLAASTPEAATAPATPVPDPAQVTPVPAPVPEPVSPAAAPVSGPDGPVEIAHKKVITPLDTEPKKDINTLLAIEEAKEAAAAPPAAPTAIVAEATGPAIATPLGTAPVLATPPVGVTPAEQPSGAPATPVAPPPSAPGSAGIDPNSIAL